MGIAEWQPDRFDVRLLPHHTLERTRQDQRQGIYRKDNRHDRADPHDRRKERRRSV